MRGLHIEPGDIVEFGGIEFEAKKDNSGIAAITLFKFDNSGSGYVSGEVHNFGNWSSTGELYISADVWSKPLLNLVKKAPKEQPRSVTLYCGVRRTDSLEQGSLNTDFGVFRFSKLVSTVPQFKNTNTKVAKVTVEWLDDGN